MREGSAYGLTRKRLEHRFRHLRLKIENNVGGGGRWSVEVPNGCLGNCDTLAEAHTIVRNFIELCHEQSGCSCEDAVGHFLTPNRL